MDRPHVVLVDEAECTEGNLVGQRQVRDHALSEKDRIAATWLGEATGAGDYGLTPDYPTQERITPPTAAGSIGCSFDLQTLEGPPYGEAQNGPGWVRPRIIRPTRRWRDLRRGWGRTTRRRT